MKKRNIDDAMVERAIAKMEEMDWETCSGGKSITGTRVDDDVRALLDAALNPPELEIEVSEKMRTAGAVAFNDTARELLYAGGILRDQIAAAFRAMECARREEAASVHCRLCNCVLAADDKCHYSSTTPAPVNCPKMAATDHGLHRHYRVGRDLDVASHFHRRATDPK